MTSPVPAQVPETVTVASGSTGTFPLGFAYEAASHVVVEVETSGVAVIQTLGEDYTLVGDTIEFIADHWPEAGATVRRWRDTPVEQGEAFGDAAQFQPLRNERGFNRLTRIAQEQAARSARGFTVPIGEAGVTLPPLAVRANRFLGFDSNGLPTAADAIVNLSPITDGDMLPPALAALSRRALGVPGVRLETYGLDGAALVRALSEESTVVHVPDGLGRLMVPAEDTFTVMRGLDRIVAEGAGPVQIELAPGRFQTDDGDLGVIGANTANVELYGAGPIQTDLSSIASVVAQIDDFYRVTAHLDDTTGLEPGQFARVRGATPFPHLSGDESLFRVRVHPGEMLNCSAALGNVTVIAGQSTITWASVDADYAPGGLSDVVHVGDLITVKGFTRKITAVDNATRTATVGAAWPVGTTGSSRAYWLAPPSSGTAAAANTAVVGLTGGSATSEANPGDLMFVDGMLLGVVSVDNDNQVTLTHPVTLTAGTPFAFLTAAITHEGVHEIVAVDHDAGTATWDVRYRGPHAPPVNGVTGGKVTVFRSVLEQTGEHDGLVFEQNGSIARIDGLCIVGAYDGIGLATNGRLDEGVTQKGYNSSCVLGDDMAFARWSFGMFLGLNNAVQFRATAVSDCSSISVWLMEGAVLSGRQLIVTGGANRGLVANANSIFLCTETHIIGVVSDGCYLVDSQGYGEIPFIWGCGGAGIRISGAETAHLNEGMIAWAGFASIYALTNVGMQVERMVMAASASSHLNLTAASGSFNARECWITGARSAGQDGVESASGHLAAPDAAFTGNRDQGYNGIGLSRLEAQGAVFRKNGTDCQFSLGARVDISDAWVEGTLLIASGADVFASALNGPYTLVGSPGINQVGSTGAVLRNGSAPVVLGMSSVTGAAVGTENDWNPGHTAQTNELRVVAGASAAIAGLRANSGRTQLLTLREVGGSLPLIVKHETGTTAAYRFLLPDNKDIRIPALGSAVFWYDPGVSRWRPVGAVRSVETEGFFGEIVAEWDWSSPVTAVDFTGLGEYRDWRIEMFGVQTDTVGTDAPILQLLVNGIPLSANYEGYGAAVTTHFPLAANAAAASVFGAVVEIGNINIPTRKTTGWSLMAQKASTTTAIRGMDRTVAEAATGFRLRTAGGVNLTAGKVCVRAKR